MTHRQGALEIVDVIEDVIGVADRILPTELRLTDESVGDMFGCAATRRLIDLLVAETCLGRSGLGATSRLHGRAAIEAWLWAVYFFLDADSAVERLIAESRGHERRRVQGHLRLWERVEAYSGSGLDHPGPMPPSEGTAPPNVKELAEAVADARRERDLPGADKADGEYHNTYRWDSVHDVHPSFELFMRYFELDGTLHVRLFPTARPDDGDWMRGLGGALETARLLGDAVGVYCRTREVTVDRDDYEKLLTIAGFRIPEDPLPGAAV